MASVRRAVICIGNKNRPELKNSGLRRLTDVFLRDLLASYTVCARVCANTLFKTHSLVTLPVLVYKVCGFLKRTRYCSHLLLNATLITLTKDSSIF